MNHDPRRARLTGAITLLIAAITPFWLWRHVIADIARANGRSLTYLVGWAPWALLVVAVLFLIPVMWSIGRRPHDRGYPRGRNAYLGWGITLYLLGVVLATQVASMHDAAFG